MNDPKCQDKPKPNELVDEYCHRVSDLGIPLSKDGGKSLEKFGEECDKRNQDIVGIHICSDWNGYGVSEVSHIKTLYIHDLGDVDLVNR